MKAVIAGAIVALLTGTAATAQDGTTAPAAGAVTLASLAQHRSGLPRLPVVPGMLGRSWRLWRHQQNPYGDTLAELLEQTRATPVGRPRASYSNLGFELLGHAIAAAAGLTYADLAAAAHLSAIDYLGDVPWYEDEAAKAWYARVKSRPSFRPLLSEWLAGVPASRTYVDLDF